MEKVFVCALGDYQQLALDQPGCFAVPNPGPGGGNWLCYEAPDPDFINRPEAWSVAEKILLREAMARQGMPLKVSRWMVVRCRDREELVLKLAAPPPSLRPQTSRVIITGETPNRKDP